MTGRTPDALVDVDDDPWGDEWPAGEPGASAELTAALAELVAIVPADEDDGAEREPATDSSAPAMPEPQTAMPAQDLPQPVALAERPHALQVLERRLGATSDVGLRLRQVARWMREETPDAIAESLAYAAQASIAGDLRAVYLTLALWLLHARPRPQFPVGHWPVPDDALTPAGAKMALVAETAYERRLSFVHVVLRDAFARVTPGDNALLALHPSVEKWPLGLRRERARGIDKNHLQFLLLDTTPAVVQLLAENPRVLEPHVVQIATLRSQHPWALQSLMMVPRWLGNERVGEAVARSPSAPPWLVLLLAPLLGRKLQRALVHLPWIRTDIREILATWHGLSLQPPRDPLPEEATGIFEVAAADLALDLHEILKDTDT